MKWIDTFGEDYKVVQFDSITDMAKFITENRDKRDWQILKSASGVFCNNCTFDEAYNQMVYGYNCNQQVMDSVTDFFDMDFYGGSNLIMDVEGSAYDIGSVVQDIPECCISDTTVEGKKYLRLVASVGFNSSVKSEHIINRGLAIAGLASSLLLKGYVVDLDFMMEYNPNLGKKAIFFLRVPTGLASSSMIAFFNSPQFLRKICIGVADFILEEDINGNATGIKDKKILDWFRKNSLYFEDGYDINDNTLVEMMYKTPEKSKETIKKLFYNWLENKEK